MRFLLTITLVTPEAARCNPVITAACAITQNEDVEEEDSYTAPVKDAPQSELLCRELAENDSLSPMPVKPLYVMAWWSHPRTRDRCLAVMVVPPTGFLDRDDGVRAEVMDDEL